MESDVGTAPSSNEEGYTLHYFPFSLYSLMARFCIVLGRSLDPAHAPKVDIKLVNMHREENLSEAYLKGVNQKGQVPSLTGGNLAAPLTDSHDIANWACDQQPALNPAEYADSIQDLVDKIYAFHAKALCVPPEQRKDGVPNQAAALLEKSDISEPHRRALEIKSVFHDVQHAKTLEHDNIIEVEEKAKVFFSALAQTIQQRPSASTWLFGHRPTIIDGLATPLIARLLDIKRDELLPDEVKEYARDVMATQQWQDTTHGRSTQWDVSLGHVADLNPL